MSPLTQENELGNHFLRLRLKIKLPYLTLNINNSLHLARKYARIFVCGQLRGADTVQGQISEHILDPNGGFCVCYSSNLFRNERSFDNWGIFSDILRFQLRNIWSRDVFRPIVRERKYLMDYKLDLSSDICPRILSVPRSKQLWGLRNR